MQLLPNCFSLNSHVSFRILVQLQAMSSFTFSMYLTKYVLVNSISSMSCKLELLIVLALSELSVLTLALSRNIPRKSNVSIHFRHSVFVFFLGVRIFLAEERLLLHREPASLRLIPDLLTVVNNVDWLVRDRSRGLVVPVVCRDPTDNLARVDSWKMRSVVV